MPVSELVRDLLAKRGVASEEAIQAFLSPDYALHQHSPSLLSGIERAVARVFLAMETNERIAIYADFDCDGIPGASVLHDFFEKIGYSNFEVYLPHRDREGYGFHTDAIEKLGKNGVSLIITVDVGTTAIDSVRFAKEKGIDVIVTDHHEIPGELPDAVAVLNPKLAPYPFPNLCGAGVAFKFVQALLIEGRRRGLENFTKIPEGWEKWLLDLVAIATVADMVPLIGENRVLAYWGLQVLRKSPRPGIAALCTTTRMRKASITEDDIGFMIAPRINAASRMDEPDLAFRLLTTDSSTEADLLAQQLEKLNASRKGIVAGIVKTVRQRAKARFGPDEMVVVLGDTEWKPALLGLAANSIVGDRGGVAVLWGRDVNGKLKGSARSDGSLSVVALFSAAADCFDEYGGHEASGGFSVKPDKVHVLPEALAKAAASLITELKAEELISHDALVALREISTPLMNDISRLAPFGMENPKPVLRIPRTRIISVRRFGKDKNHTEVTLVCAETGMIQRAFQYFKAPEHFSRIPEADLQVDVLATLEIDKFGNSSRPVLRLIDIFASN